jgi:hypothetical protein
VCDLLTNPRRLEQKYQDGGGLGTSLQDIDNLRVEGRKLQHGLERIIDSLAEGLIDKEQFTSRMTQTKSRITELDTKINADTGDADRQDQMRGLASRLRDLAANIGPHIADADWARGREMIRTLVQRIEIGTEKVMIVFRLSPDGRGAGPESIVVTLSRVCRRRRPYCCATRNHGKHARKRPRAVHHPRRLISCSRLGQPKADSTTGNWPGSPWAATNFGYDPAGLAWQ